jgi:hypothetical protein
MTELQQNGFMLVKNFIDLQSIETISKYFQYSMNQNLFKLVVGRATTSFGRYADPLIEVVLESSLPEVEQLTGFKLFPTYSVSRVYTKGAELKRHTDRHPCEISVSVQVATQGKPWPLWMQAQGKDPVNYTLEPGDAVIYKGCEVEHWRIPAEDTDVVVQFILHYVNTVGPHADLKFDRRPSLGINTK